MPPKIETKEEVRERIIALEKPKCPHCAETMDLWEVPPINFSDGLGWGTPYLYVCFNDDCPTYDQGWAHMAETYAHSASFRCICYPEDDNRRFELMPVFSPQGGQGQVITDRVLAQEEALKANIKRGFSVLTDCYNRKDMVPVMRMLLDPAEPVRVRIKAAGMMGDFGELEAIEPIRNLTFGNAKLQDAAEEAVKKIHARYFTRECPFCAEIIKQRAKICKHCGKEVAGE